MPILKNFEFYSTEHEHKMTNGILAVRWHWFWLKIASLHLLLELQWSGRKWHEHEFLLQFVFACIAAMASWIYSCRFQNQFFLPLRFLLSNHFQFDCIISLLFVIESWEIANNYNNKWLRMIRRKKFDFIFVSIVFFFVFYFFFFIRLSYFLFESSSC